MVSVVVEGALRMVALVVEAAWRMKVSVMVGDGSWLIDHHPNNIL